MAMQGDVSSTLLSATGNISAGPCRLKGLYMVAAALAGTVVIRDGGAGGTTRASFATPAGVGAVYIELPGEGILFRTDCHATITTTTSITAFYG